MSAHASKGIRFVPKTPPLLGHAPRVVAAPSVPIVLVGSIAPRRTARTRFIASSGSRPVSTSNRAAIIPARPRPPRQWTRMFSPAVSRDLRRPLASFHFASNSGPGVLTSVIGMCTHIIPRRLTSGPSRLMPHAVINRAYGVRRIAFQFAENGLAPCLAGPDARRAFELQDRGEQGEERCLGAMLHWRDPVERLRTLRRRSHTLVDDNPASG